MSTEHPSAEDYFNRAQRADQALAERDAEIVALKARLDMLQRREAAYRSAHDLHGDSSMKAGRAWDEMRRAGDKAREALNGDYRRDQT